MAELSMKSKAPDHPWLFFALIYGLSVPFWILSTQMKKSGLPDNLPVTDIGAVLTPTIAAVILRSREAGASGVRELFRRIFDYSRIEKKRWLVIAIIVFPLLYLITYLAMRVLDYPVATGWNPPPGLVGVFFLFFVAAIAEELGYSAYGRPPEAHDRTQCGTRDGSTLGSLAFALDDRHRAVNRAHSLGAMRHCRRPYSQCLDLQQRRRIGLRGHFDARHRQHRQNGLPWWTPRL